MTDRASLGEAELEADAVQPEAAGAERTPSGEVRELLDGVCTTAEKLVEDQLRDEPAHAAEVHALHFLAIAEARPGAIGRDQDHAHSPPDNHCRAHRGRSKL
jgi:hypothetical protein